MREQAYRDPVHGFVTVTDELLLRLIDAPEFQRLRRIRQLGASCGTYHGAEQSRFGHSLGAMWVMQRVLERLAHSGFRIAEEVRITALCAALLHDLGHGPFSHALEGQLVPGVRHEVWSIRMLLEETEIHRLLQESDPALPSLVALVLAGEYEGPRFVMELVSSQLDVDRMDYLLRDSLYTGVTYGRFDLHRIINTLQLVDEGVVVQAKGVVAIEEYVLARYFMYWQVYLHKATRSQELLLQGAWNRAVWLWKQGALVPEDVAPGLLPFLHDETVGLGSFLAVDDYDFVSSLKKWRHHSDFILADLAARFLDRRLLKPVFKVPHTGDISGFLEVARDLVRQNGWDPEYYVLIDHTRDSAYDTYSEEEGPEGRKPPILGLDERGKPTEITKLSETIKAVACRPRQAVNVYVPQDCVEEARALFSM
jgi:HD superfamily phosphohydrolase